jgi:hypothetical protein
MKYTMQKSWYLVVVALALMLMATGPLAAQPPTTTFNLTSAGSGANLAGVYTSPYYGTVSPGGSTIPVICDDFADDSYVPEQWTAYVTSLSSLSSSTPDAYLKWAGATVGSTTLTQVQAYTVAAVLAVDILNSAGTPQEDYSFAMWGLFDPAGAFTQLSNYGDIPDENMAKTYLNSAVSYAFNSANAAQVTADVNAVTIYSYDKGATSSQCGGPCTQPQEFIAVSMAEPPSTALLGLDLLAVAGLMFFVRRRLKSTQV